MFIPQSEQMLEKSNAMGTTLRCMLISAGVLLSVVCWLWDEVAETAALLLQEIKNTDAARMPVKMKYFLMGVLILVRR